MMVILPSLQPHLAFNPQNIVLNHLLDHSQEMRLLLSTNPFVRPLLHQKQQVSKTHHIPPMVP